MDKSRLEAFSDGVIAIILTIMVLDLKVPKEPTLEALGNFWPIYFAYALSYGNVFFVWLNHHDIFASLKDINRSVLLSNGLLLFVVSLIPFATAFASQSNWKAPLSVAAYGIVLVAVCLAFGHLRLVAGKSTADAKAAEHYRKEARISLALAALFLLGSLCAWFLPISALFLYAAGPLLRGLLRPFGRSRSEV